MEKLFDKIHNQKQDEKKCAVLLALFEQKQGAKALARKLKVDVKTVYRVKESLKVPTSEQQEKTERKTARKQALQREKELIVGELKSYISGAAKCGTIRDMRLHLASKFDESVSLRPSRIRKLLQGDLGLSYKKVSQRQPQGMTKEKEIERVKVCYAAQVLEVEKGYMPVYIDEYAVSDATARKYTWAPRGKPHFVAGPQNMKTLSVIAAISPRGIEGLQVFKGTIKTAEFNHFLD